MPEKIKFGNIEFDINNSPLKNFTKYIGFFILGLLILSSVYTVDANENAVILRLGKYNTTTGPGLQFKFPLLDKVYKVKNLIFNLTQCFTISFTELTPVLCPSILFKLFFFAHLLYVFQNKIYSILFLQFQYAFCRIHSIFYI